MKHIIVILTIMLLTPLVFSACKTNMQNNVTMEVPDDALNSQTTEALNDNEPIDKSELFTNIGKTLSTLKSEHPKAEIIIKNYGFPDAAAVGFGEPEGKYAYLFFEAQDGDADKAINELGAQLKCAGFITTADVLFPDMKDEMSFSDFFSLIGVSDYDYGAEKDTVTEGWLDFTYDNMDVWLNTNEFTGSYWDFTGVESIKRNAPVIISNRKILQKNFELANAIMFK